MVLLIIIPIKWLFHWEYTLFSDKPISSSSWLKLNAQVAKGLRRRRFPVVPNVDPGTAQDVLGDPKQPGDFWWISW
jgi:hypothetical protein